MAGKILTGNGKTRSRLIGRRIADRGGWRGGMLARVRGIVVATVPDAVEARKWSGVPVRSRDGIDIHEGDAMGEEALTAPFRAAAALDPG